MDEKKPDTAPVKTPEDERIDSLEERLRSAQAREMERTGSKQPKPDENERLGNRVFSLLIGGLIGGTVIGYAADRIFGTGNLLLVVGMVLGILGGFYSIIRVASK
ncbi:AtpZ/AtpI family protein [Sphingomicrobium lutaoense]|uniref:ATP synthase protein I n=1 Tax=Sphingomicrobium lutaoense TaxID=515949 RepID=A0A839Z393_9SPHN|nr:AtpZ/AtpI family protein [Sphingomicrobium lutaoense]MBB3764072.1 ATP synthase protein I [Sphingomicrobium lutaoense]